MKSDKEYVITYLTGDSDEFRTLQIIGIPDGVQRIEGHDHWMYRRPDGNRIGIKATRVIGLAERQYEERAQRNASAKEAL